MTGAPGDTPPRQGGFGRVLRGSGGSAGSAGSSDNLVATVTGWILRLAVLNLIWVLQTLAGGVLLGLAPATWVLYGQVRDRLAGADTDEGFRASWSRWRRDFWSAQARYLLPILTVAVLGFYLWMVRGQFLAVTVAVLAAFYLCWLMHLPAVGARLDGTSPDGTTPDGTNPDRSNQDGSRPHEPLRASALWLLALRSFAARPAAFLIGWAVVTVAMVLGVFYAPAALVFAVPSVPALVASLVVRRVPDVLLDPAGGAR